MTLYEKHVFICENDRDSNNPLGCCSSRGAKEITQSLKKLCQDAGLKNKVRVNKSGCLGQCKKGPVMVIYPEGAWYQQVSKEDVPEIFTNHILNNKVVERLKLPNES